MSCPREQAWRRRRWFCVTSLPGVQPEPDSAEARPDLCTAVVVRAWLRPRRQSCSRPVPAGPSETPRRRRLASSRHAQRRGLRRCAVRVPPAGRSPVPDASPGVQACAAGPCLRRPHRPLGPARRQAAGSTAAREWAGRLEQATSPSSFKAPSAQDLGGVQKPN